MGKYYAHKTIHFESCGKEKIILNKKKKASFDLFTANVGGVIEKIRFE